MKMPHVLASLAVALSAFACQSATTVDAPAPTQAPVAEGSLDALFPDPKSALEVGAQGQSLDELLGWLSKSSGVVFSASESQVRPRLREERISLSQSTVVQPRDVHTWIESLLLERGFFLTCDTNARPTLVSVHSARSAGSVDVPSVQASLEDRDFLRRHPALHFTICLELPHIDVRTLGSTLRPLTSSDAGAGIFPVANTNSVILRGNGRTVSQLLDVLERVEAGAAKALSGDPRAPLEARRAPEAK